MSEFQCCAQTSLRRTSLGTRSRFLPECCTPGWECWTHPSEGVRLETIGLYTHDSTRLKTIEITSTRLKTIQNDWATAPSLSFSIVSYRFFLKGPGCTLGYGSNPDQVNFCTIPKVPEWEKIWKTTIRRIDNAVKSRRAVYKKHFLENQINMRKREFFDTNGRVIGVVSTIECMYLYWNCFELKSFHIIVIVGTSVQNTTFKARQCAINFSMVRGNMSDTRRTVVPCARCTQWSRYKWDCTLRCSRRWGSSSIPKSCSESKKCLSPEFVRILSTAELSLPSGWVMTSHEIEGSKLVILLTHKNIKKD